MRARTARSPQFARPLIPHIGPFRSRDRRAGNFVLVELRLDVEKLDALKRAVDQAGNSVEKPGTQHVLVEEIAKGRSRPVQKFLLEPAAALGLRSHESRRKGIFRGFLPAPHARFPVGVLVVLLDVSRKALDVAMKKFIAENTCSSADHHVLVDFHVAHGAILIGGAAFKAAFAKAKERQLVEAGAAVAQTASEKNNIEADVTTAESRI